MKEMPVKGYEGFYTIREDGEVKSLARKTSDGRNIKERILTPKTIQGYAYVPLSNNGVCHRVRLHRLVASHFIRDGMPGEVVNHIDGNKLNNNCQNLEWCTPSENNLHALKNGLKAPKLGNRHHRFTSTVIATNIKTGDSISLNGKQEIISMGFDYSTVRNCVAGKRKAHKGYIFKSVENEI